MTRFSLAILATLALTACVSMPTTTLRDDKGHTIACGGETSSVLPVAYVIDKGVDEACIARAKGKGFHE